MQLQYLFQRLILQEFTEITIDGSQRTRLGVDKARKRSFLFRQLNK